MIDVIDCQGNNGSVNEMKWITLGSSVYGTEDDLTDYQTFCPSFPLTSMPSFQCSDVGGWDIVDEENQIGDLRAWDLHMAQEDGLPIPASYPKWRMNYSNGLPELMGVNNY